MTIQYENTVGEQVVVNTEAIQTLGQISANVILVGTVYINGNNVVLDQVVSFYANKNTNDEYFGVLSGTVGGTTYSINVIKSTYNASLQTLDVIDYVTVNQATTQTTIITNPSLEAKNTANTTQAQINQFGSYYDDTQDQFILNNAATNIQQDVRIQALEDDVVDINTDISNLTDRVVVIEDEQIVQNDNIASNTQEILDLKQSQRFNASFQRYNVGPNTISTTLTKLLTTTTSSIDSNLPAIADFNTITGNIKIGAYGRLVINFQGNYDPTSASNRVLTISLRNSGGGTVLKEIPINLSSTKNFLNGNITYDINPSNFPVLPIELSVYGIDSVGTTIYSNVYWTIALTGGNVSGTTGLNTDDILNVSQLSGTSTTDALNYINTNGAFKNRENMFSVSQSFNSDIKINSKIKPLNTQFNSSFEFNGGNPQIYDSNGVNTVDISTSQMRISNKPLNMSFNKIVDVLTPTNPNEAATKFYVDSNKVSNRKFNGFSGISSSITLDGLVNGIDGITSAEVVIVYNGENYNIKLSMYDVSYWYGVVGDRRIKISWTLVGNIITARIDDNFQGLGLGNFHVKYLRNV